MRRTALPTLLLMVTACSSPAPQGPLVGQPLVEELRGGGHVLFLRHTETVEGAGDEPDSLGDCTRQRLLSPTGRENARALGEAVRLLEVPVGDVVASPFCRTVETAELAFGRTTTDDGLVVPGADGPSTAATPERVRALLGTEPREGTNTVLVGHLTGLLLASETSVDTGATVVFRPLGDGSFVVAGEVGPRGWQALADQG